VILAAGAVAICLAAGEAHARIPATHFTLAWQHTIERIDWEEDYLVAGDWLFLSAARVRGSGAGMDPGPGAVWIDGAWTYPPRVRWFRELTLARSEFGADHRLCLDGRCRPLAHWVPLASPTTIAPCAAQ
jgi:hypothetical protein